MQYMKSQRLSAEEKAKRDEAREAREAEIRLRNNQLGITIFQWSWIMVFVCLVVMYWQMGFNPGWRPTPEQAPSPVLPTLATISLIASAFFGHRALNQARATIPNSQPQFRQSWLIAIGLGAAFLVVMAQQYLTVPISDDGQQFGYVYRLLIGYHVLHAVVIGAMMLQIWRLGRDGRYHSEHNWPIEATKRLWDFVVVAWLLFYAVLYVPFVF